MLIKSKFHDYYDTASAYGIDKECIYVREETILDGKFEFDDPFSKRWPDHDTLKKRKKGVSYEYVVKTFVVGFCGTLYPLIVVMKYHKEEVEEKEVTVTEKFHFYSAEKLMEFYKEQGFKVSEERPGKWTSRYFDATGNEHRINVVFDPNNYKKLLKEFHEHRCPYFVYGRLGKDGPKLVLNPKLNYYRFGQVKDATTAFQDVFMYLSGVLGAPPKETVTLSDKQKAKKAGHDSKYSFRKPPGKRGDPKWR